jgi:hypothetical protein
VVDPLLDRWMAGGGHARAWLLSRVAGRGFGALDGDGCWGLGWRWAAGGQIFREINQDNKRERTCMELSLANCLSCGGE